MAGHEEKYIHEAFDANAIAPVGDNLDAFEQSLETYNGTENAIALTSGTAAIHLAMIMEKLGPGDVVFCQDMTFCASINPIFYRNAIPVLVDSDPGTWNIDLNLLEFAIEDIKKNRPDLRPKAILPVHLYGMPVNMERLNQIAHQNNLVVFEDAAESLGSKYKEKFTGSWGEYGIYSFNGNKIITTSGGGALTTASADKAKEALNLATQARDNAPHYQHSKIGYNYRLSNVLAGIGLAQMKVLDARVKARRENFERYKAFFKLWNKKGFDFKFQEEPKNAYSNRWLSAILINPETNLGLTREKLRLHLEKFNIEARPLWKPMHLQPVFKDVIFYGNGASERLFEQGLCLPSGSSLTDEELNRIFEAIASLLKIVIK
jgi:dTDP-4-amino-4,6-dideoxygalactose transaminase